MRHNPFTTSLVGVLLAAAALLSSTTNAEERPHAIDILIADFEGGTYDGWTAEGEAFGDAPATGTLPGQMHVDGFRGKGLVNSFRGGDRTTGTLASPTFVIQRPWINFLIGGGGYKGETCMRLLVDGRIVREAEGPNLQPGGQETLDQASWHVADLIGKQAVLEIVDNRTGGWGHINVDHIVQSDIKRSPTLVELSRTLTVDDSHLLVPVANDGPKVLLGIFDGDTLVQNFTVALPKEDAPHWTAAYPLASFGVEGKTITIAPVDGGKLSNVYEAAFNEIAIGAEGDAHADDDYDRPYRNQFHVSSRHGWNNDPNGMVHHDGVYHLFYQYNPFGIFWGNMHWGHFTSKDLVHWEQQPIKLFQKTTADMAFSGGGFVDFNNSAGLGDETLFIAFTSTGRGAVVGQPGFEGECLAYSTDGGKTFDELEESPVVVHHGRDPKVIWYEPERKWVMAMYDTAECDETRAIAPRDGERHTNANCAFYESKDLRTWTRTGAFTDPDRGAVHECPELFELPIVGHEGESRWIIYGAQNRYSIGQFDGKTFHKESGPHGDSHGSFYAAQTFSDTPDGRRIQIGWVRTPVFLEQFPAQITNQSFTLPHELTLHETDEGLRVFFNPVEEVLDLRAETLAEGENLTIEQANELLQACRGELTEVEIALSDGGVQGLVVNGIDVGFEGERARIFTDRTFSEVYVDGGRTYAVRARKPEDLESQETRLTAGEDVRVASLKIHRLKSIWSDAE